MNWIVLKALNTLFEKGEVPQKISLNANGEIIYLKNSLHAIEFKGKKIMAMSEYRVHYMEHYNEDYQKYLSFLNEFDLVKPQSRYEESDIQILMKIHGLRQDGALDEIRHQILEANESLRGLSQMFFKHDKYLDNKPSIIKALKRILDIEVFSNEKDQQYIYKLECHDPKMIVLCENIDYLTKPGRPRMHGIELWYAGGKNVAKLEFTVRRELPIYYSCDWDYDGLFIIYPLVKEHIPEIQLLTPTGNPKGIKESEHKSLWRSGSLDIDKLGFDEKQQVLLDQLIEKDRWVIEESNDLLAMLKI
jgi:hypothetical protein